MQLLILGIVVGMTFFFGALAASSALRGRAARRRLARLAEGGGSAATVGSGERETTLLPSEGGFWVRLLRPLAGRAKKPEEVAEGVRRRLIEAGFRTPSALPIYMGSRVALAMALPPLTAALATGSALSQLQFIILVCSAAGVGMVLPSYWLDRKRAARQRSIILGLPDALDLMVVCVEAGLGINASLARVAREFERANPILALEFELVSLEVRAGKSSTEALRSLARRTGVSEISSLVSMLVQTERFGTNLADTLRIHAESMRSRRMLRAEEQAGKAPLKMLFPTVVIFLATLIVTIGPGLLRMFEFFGEQ